MTSTDEEPMNARTLAAYEAHAQRYREQTENLVSDGDRQLLLDLAGAAPPGVVLEIGSAHGRDARALESLGRSVRRTDAARAFVDLLRADGHLADVLDVLTDQLVDDHHGPYAAVLANAVFLHFQPDELRGVLAKVLGALLPGGVLGFSVKVGEGSGWSTHKLGAPRFFQYWQPDPLRRLVERQGFTIVGVAVDEGPVQDWIRVLARRPALPDSGSGRQP